MAEGDHYSAQPSPGSPSKKSPSSSSHKAPNSDIKSDAGHDTEAASTTPATNPPLPSEPTPADPPLPNEPAPPLPDGAPPNDDGWDAIWDVNASAYYFYNRITQQSQWDNPRVPTAPAIAPIPGPPPGVELPSSTLGDRSIDPGPSSSPPHDSSRPRYNPAIHGSYDPNADYARYDAEEAAEAERQSDIQAAIAAGADPAAAYAATGRFNRFTGKWQRADLAPENFNDENKSYRQQRAFFDVDSAANTHDGRSLKAERANKKLSKDEVKAFREKRKAKKEEKRRAWLRD